MAFPTRLLTEGEEIILDLRPHWIALFVPFLWTLLAGAALGFILNADLDWWVALIPVVLWIPLAGISYLAWRFTTFVLSNERVITRSGIIAKHSKEIPLETINDVTFNQSILERMLNAGDLIIESAGESGQNRFTDIRKPEQVQLEVYRAAEARKGLGRPAAGSGSVADELAKLADLRDRGVLTGEEFEARKRRLLDS